LIGRGDHSENTNSGIAKRKVLKPGPAGYTETGKFRSPQGVEATLNDIAWPGTVADRPNLDMRGGDQLIQEVTQGAEIAIDGDLKRENLLSVPVDEEHIGFTLRYGGDIDAGRGLHHGIDQVRIGDHDVAYRARKLDDHRFVHAKVHFPRCGKAAIDAKQRLRLRVREGRPLLHCGIDRERRDERRQH